MEARVIKAMAQSARLMIVDELSRHEAVLGSQLKDVGIGKDEKRGAQLFGW
ncbi:MAG TPA: hypothetical protein VN673_12850 [Clostridia bacterium]|nr:hypothetical protein [Clostridia bacterium]